MDMLLNRYTDRYVAGDGMCGVGCCRVPTNLWTDMQVMFNNVKCLEAIPGEYNRKSASSAKRV